MYDQLSDAQLMDLARSNWGSLVTVEQSKLWPGQLTWQNLDPRALPEAYPDYVSRYGQLNELFCLQYFVEQLQKDGYTVGFATDTYDVQCDFDRWFAPLPIEGLTLRTSTGRDSQLWDYQRFSLNRALERMQSRHRHDRFFSFGWGAGTGKSAACSAGALEAIHRGQVEVVLAFTMRKLQLNLRDFFTAATPLHTVVADGTKAKRTKLYADADVQVYVNNYDKAWHDFELLSERTKGKRVLFIFDEASVLLTADKRTRARKAMDLLINQCHSTVWPMSASMVDYSPFTYHDNYSLGSASSKTHPLGTKKDFQARYCNGVSTKTWAGPNGGYFTVKDYDWNHTNLQEVRHRVAHCTQNARKTDPGVRDNFPGIQTEVIRVQLSNEDRKLYETVRAWARAAAARGESPGAHVELMRYICNHPSAVGLTRHALGGELVAAHPTLVNGRHSSKLEVFCDQVASIASGGDQVVGFTRWVDLTLHLVSPELARRNLRFVDHHGDMSDRVAYEAQQAFKSDPGCTLFWSSDAGSHGLNFQNARYVINYDPPRSWAKLNQRMSRIDRADGELLGRTNYVLVTDDTVEEKIWEENQRRLALAEATTGAHDAASYGDVPEDITPELYRELLDL